MQKDFFD